MHATFWGHWGCFGSSFLWFIFQLAVQLMDSLWLCFHITSVFMLWLYVLRRSAWQNTKEASGGHCQKANKDFLWHSVRAGAIRYRLVKKIISTTQYKLRQNKEVWSFILNICCTLLLYHKSDTAFIEHDCSCSSFFLSIYPPVFHRNIETRM